MGLAKQLRAVLTLPFVVTVVIPSILLFGFSGIDSHWLTASAWYALVFPVAVLLLLAGSFLFAVTVYLFHIDGQGTLAPWSPTQKLVVRGPYKLVQNPMITGVLAILLGESLLLGSFVLGLWAATFFGVNHIYFILSEEPGLKKRFGGEYETYMNNVPRWFPKPDTLTYAGKDNVHAQPD